jgi:hypothetical protein
VRIGVGVFVAAGLLLAGCGGSTSAASLGSTSPSPQPTPGAAGWSGPSKQFRSPQLGIAFSYPASWKLRASDADSSFATYGLADFGLETPVGAARQGILHFQVESRQIYTHQPPRPYISVGPDAARKNRRLEAQVQKEQDYAWGLAYVGGLRLVTAQLIRDVPSPTTGTGRWRQQVYSSGASSEAPYATGLTIETDVPAARAHSAAATLAAILSTVRFSTPIGGWQGA